MAIDPNIKKKADDIRNKIYGKEVRESLASGLEEMSSDVVENEGRQSVVEGRQSVVESRQDSVESQWQSVSDEMTDKDVISAPEIIAARNGESNLKARLDKEKNEVTAQLAQTESKLKGAVNIAEFEHLKTLGSDGFDWSNVFQGAIDSIKSDYQNEDNPDEPPSGTIVIPNGKFPVYNTIKIPSNVRVVGGGIDTSIIESFITDGTPTLLVTGDNEARQSFHSSLSAFTVHGGLRNNIGIEFRKVSRWNLNLVKINESGSHGLYLFESWIGDVITCQIRKCGSATKSSVLLTGRSANYGNHAVTFLGGEINGFYNIKAGLEIEFGSSNAVYGTTIEGFYDGYGVIDSGISTVLNGVYMEKNQGFILSLNTNGSSYTGNFMTDPAEGAIGYVVIDRASGMNLSDNSMLGFNDIIHINKLKETSVVSQSTISTNLTNTPPLRVADGLINPTRGSSLEYFDSSFHLNSFGQKSFEHRVRLKDGIEFKSNGNRIVYDEETNIMHHNTAGDLFDFNKRIRTVQQTFTNIPLSEAKSDSLFVDLADGKLKFKSGTGDVKTVSLI